MSVFLQWKIFVTKVAGKKYGSVGKAELAQLFEQLVQSPGILGPDADKDIVQADDMVMLGDRGTLLAEPAECRVVPRGNVDHNIGGDIVAQKCWA